MTHEERRKIIAERSRKIRDFLMEHGLKIWEEGFDPEGGSIPYTEHDVLYHVALSMHDEDYVHASRLESYDLSDEREKTRAVSVANLSTASLSIAKVYTGDYFIHCAAEFYCTPFDSFRIVFFRYVERIKRAHAFFMKEIKKPAAPQAFSGSSLPRLSTPILDSLSVPRLSFGSAPPRREGRELWREMIREVLKKVNTP